MKRPALVILAVVMALFASSCRTDVSIEAEETAELDQTEHNQTEQAEEPARFELRGELPLTTAEVNELMAFIEAETRRAFLYPPTIVAQTADEYIAGFADDLESFAGDPETSGRRLQALGLTELGVAEASAALVTMLASPQVGAQGYYDPEVDELYVPIGATGDADFLGLLVHELTHAHDAQHVDFGTFEQIFDEADASGDRELAVSLRTIAEGRATSVQNRWFAATGNTQTIPDDLSLQEAVPTALLLELGLPYALGEQFIEANGGPGGTWDLLENPPATTEEVMVLGAAVGVEAVVQVATPDAEGPILAESVFGVADILVWFLGNDPEPDPAFILPALTAADGWAGGKAVLWGDDTESCMRVAFAADSAVDLSEFQDLGEVWVEAGDDRTVAATNDLVTITGCAPYVP